MSRRIKDCGKPECGACKELFAEHRRVREAMSRRRKARNVYRCGRCLGEYVNPHIEEYGSPECPHCFVNLDHRKFVPKIIGHQEYHPSWFWSRPSTWFSGVWCFYPQVVVLK